MTEPTQILLPKLKTRKKNLIRRRQKAPDDNQALNKIIQKNYTTKGEKMEVTVYAYGRKLEPDEEIIVPKGHHFYNVLDGIANEMLDKEEGVA